MKSRLEGKNVSFVNEKSLFSDSQLNNMEGVYIATYSAVADIYILGNSQQCIMTEYSTFAYAGCAITGKPPVIIPWTSQECLEGDSLRELWLRQVGIERRITVVVAAKLEIVYYLCEQ